MYWRAFDRAEDLDDKLDVVRRLTELYLQRNQLDRLLTRLQHQEREERPGGNAPSASQGRDVAICMAQAYATSGDLGAARAELERLLAANTRDTQLLQQLSKLAEEEGDLESAARYQKQLNELAPSDEGATRLAQLYARSGDLEEAQAVWSKMAAGKGATLHVFQAIDSLLGNQKPAPVLEITEAMVRKDPRDWEALYRRGVAAALLDRPEEAAQAFRALLDADDRRRREERRRQGPGAQPEAPGPQRLADLRAVPGDVAAGGPARRGGPASATFCRLDRARADRAEVCLGAGRLRPGADGGPGLARQPGPEAGHGEGRGGRRPRSARRPRSGRPTSAPSGTGSTSARSASTTRAPSRRPASSAAPRRPTRWRSGPTCTAWAAGRLPSGQRTVDHPDPVTWKTTRPAARQGRARSRAGLLPRRSGPGGPSWPRPRSSRTSPTS